MKALVWKIVSSIVSAVVILIFVYHAIKFTLTKDPFDFRIAVLFGIMMLTDK